MRAGLVLMHTCATNGHGNSGNQKKRRTNGAPCLTNRKEGIGQAWTNSTGMSQLELARANCVWCEPKDIRTSQQQPIQTLTTNQFKPQTTNQFNSNRRRDGAIHQLFSRHQMHHCFFWTFVSFVLVHGTAVAFPAKCILTQAMSLGGPWAGMNDEF